MNLKERGTTLALAGVVAVSVALGAAGGNLISGLGAHAQTTPSTPAATPSATGGGATTPVNGAGSASGVAPTPGNGGNRGQAASGGTFKSNEDPAHEASESPPREAQEDAGQRPTGP